MTSLVLKLTSDDGFTIRGMVKDGEERYSVYDFMNKLYSKAQNSSFSRVTFARLAQEKPKCNGTSTKAFQRLIADGSEHKEDILSSCQMVKFPGRGQRATPTMTVSGLCRLMNSLRGKVSKAFRDETMSVLERYLNGDKSMCVEVKENNAMGKAKSYARFAQKVQDRIKINEQRDEQLLPSTTFVYATKSAAFPGLIKIGKAEDMAKRLTSLNTSCAPAPHVVVAVAPSLNNTRDERTAHAFFAQFRREGEFFAISDDMVKDYFTNSITAQYNRELTVHMSGSEGMCLLEN